ncbi:elastinolytic metalloprotease pseudoalterin [Pseudoalteromonas sp. L21]|uniref:elastinolytic metalloprotease pseudoalterin n=1 Tax=Pseudoalteromonas sp. L21 TaxID=1539746 RepID=UPI001EECFE0D|nr:elastinolytic metalloprotease pseudoalterin [Pseudoalteromonas sp. L21]MCF7518375.1 elastinolytic metalloprotease pseudoalterin [Pseudoalteromonas sp. L21]
MNKHLLTLAVTTGLGFSSIAFAGVHNHETFEFSDQAVEQLNLNSLLIMDDQTFVFNNDLLNEDWDNYFASYAPELQSKQAFILHWAGYYSINPKVILALIEQQSEGLSDPSVELESVFKNISDKQGFEEQVKDVVFKLSQRFYAFKHWQEQAVKHDKNSNSIKHLIRPSQVSTAATAALASMMSKQHNLHAQANDSLTRFLDIFEQLSPEQSLILNTDQVTFSGEEQSVQATFTMNLPWSQGYYWYSGGAHSNTGSGYPYSSLDFNNGSGGWGSNTPWVQAAHGGVITRFSSCNIRVTHSSGFATNYYHMSNLQYNNGDTVQPGTLLGRYANSYNQALCEGGQSSGPHVHFTLLQNGQQVSLHNRYISNYRIDVGNSNYDSNCNNFYFERNGRRTCAWQPLYR